MKKSAFPLAIILFAVSSCTDDLDDNVFLFEDVKPNLYALKTAVGQSSQEGNINSAMVKESNLQTKKENDEGQR